MSNCYSSIPTDCTGRGILLHPSGEDWPLPLLLRLRPGHHHTGLQVMASEQTQGEGGGRGREGGMDGRREGCTEVAEQTRGGGRGRGKEWIIGGRAEQEWHVKP